MGRKTFLTDETKWLSSLYSNKKYKLNKKDGFKNITKEEFIDWFDKKEYNKGCCYCGTTHETSKKIFDFQTITKGRIDGTRGQKRMHRLELERKNPIESYDNLKILHGLAIGAIMLNPIFSLKLNFTQQFHLQLKMLLIKLVKKLMI